MKYLLTLLALCSWLPWSAAQSLDWGTPVKHEKAESIEGALIRHYLINAEGAIPTRIRVERESVSSAAYVTLEQYDATLERKRDKTLVGPLSQLGVYQDIAIQRDRIIVFTTVYDTKTKVNTLRAHTFDFKGEATGQYDLASLTALSAFNTGYYEVTSAADGSHIGVMALQPFQKKTNEALTLRVFDHDFQVIQQQEVTLEHERNRIVQNLPFVTSNGTLHLFKTIKVKGIGQVYEVYTLTDGGLDRVSITLGEGTAPLSFDSRMVENPDGQLEILGLQKEDKGFRAAKGFYRVTVANDGSLLRQQSFDIGDAPKLGITGLSIKAAEYHGDKLYLFADTNGKSIGSATAGATATHNYAGGDLYLAQLGAGESLEWLHIAERSGLTQAGGRGTLMDWCWSVRPDASVEVFFNDLLRNYDASVGTIPNLIPVRLRIGSDGQALRTPLLGLGLGKPGDFYTFSPDEAYPTSGGMILKASNNIDFKLGRLTW